MSNLSMVEAKLPPGFRFHPKDEELICDYLMKKVTCCDQYPQLIEVDLNKSEPWDIPETAYLGGKEWYFYSQRDRKYATGLRTNRATTTGYWKATGKDRAVCRKGTLVGMRKTLVFYQGRAPKGKKSEWVMHEFRLEGPFGPPKASSLKDDWVLCRMFYKNKEELPPKQDNEDTHSSSLPPLLMDTFNHISYNNNNNNHQNQSQYEQVHCFSIYNPTTFSQLTQIGPTKSFPPSFETNLNPTSLINPSISCDKKFINDFINHFTKVESKGSIASLGEGSSESFLSDVGCLPNNVWSNY